MIVSRLYAKLKERGKEREEKRDVSLQSAEIQEPRNFVTDKWAMC
jgi:hypothetical protein